MKMIFKSILMMMVSSCLLISNLSFSDSKKIGPITADIEEIDRTRKTLLTLNGEKFQVDRNLRIRGPEGARVSNLKVGYRVEFYYVPAKDKGLYPIIYSLRLHLD